MVQPGDEVEFEPQDDSVARLILVEPKMSAQPLTIRTTTLNTHQQLQDATDRNDTLLIAISPVRLRGVRNVADESEWKPNRPEFWALPTGGVRWVRSGMYRLTNLLPRAVQFVTVEW